MSIVSGRDEEYMVEIYQRYYKEAIEKYGERSVVFLQCGKFFEMYDYCAPMETDDDEDDKAITNNLHEIADFLGIIVSKNDKTKRMSLGNPHKAGIPIGGFARFRNKLLEADYNVFIIEEVGEVEKGKKKERKLTQIYTPGVNPDVENYYSNNVLVVYIENQNPKQLLRRIDKYELSIGLAAMDVSTNESFVYEIHQSSCDDSTNALEEVFRFIQSHRCRELVVHLQGFKVDTSTEEGRIEAHRIKRYFKQTLELGRYHTQAFTLNKIPDEYTKGTYKEVLFGKVYDSNMRGMLSPIEYLDLEMLNVASTAFALLFKFISDRNESMLKGLSKPKVWNSNRSLVLSHNAIEQLDLVPRKSFTHTNVKRKHRCLFNIINHTTTNIGKRLLEEWMLNPLYDNKKIEERYNNIEELLSTQLKYLKSTIPKAKVSSIVVYPDSPIGNIKDYLKGISDIKRLHRKIQLSKYSPMEIGKLIKSYTQTNKLINYLSGAKLKNIQSSVIPKEAVVNNFKTTLKTILKTLNREAMDGYGSFEDIKDNLFKIGVHPDIDSIVENIKYYHRLDVMLQTQFARILIPDIKKDKIAKLFPIKQPRSGQKFFSIAKYYRGMLKWYHNKVDKEISEHIKTNDGAKISADMFSKLKIRKYESLFDFIRKHHSEVTDKCLREYTKKNYKKIFADYDNSDEDSDESMTDDEDDDGDVQYLSPREIEILRDVSFSETSAKAKVFTPIFGSAEAKLTGLYTKLTSETKKVFKAFIEKTFSDNEKVLEDIAKFVGEIDVFTSHAITAIKYGYSRPKALSNDDYQASFIRATDVRHPIIERIQTLYKYIPNDVNIGVCKDDDGGKEAKIPNGIFLMGLNNSGKTSYLKSVGLNLILAQSGCYVSAKTFKYRPFKNIITRLSGNDNIFKGQGSFAVEMSELRTVMSQSNKNTLVLGDEICHGTEQKSALAIVGASAIRLCDRKTNFIFSTHLRLLPEINLVKRLSNLEFMHFTAKPDPKTEEIIYEHKLKVGVGESMYGVEIAQTMGLERETCELAYKLRKLVDESIVADEEVLERKPKRSRYNPEVYLDRCTIEGCDAKAVDTHHIREQSEADELGRIEHFHKNETHNLIGLCEKHHHSVHDGDLKIIGFVKTTRGVKLAVE